MEYGCVRYTAILRKVKNCALILNVECGKERIFRYSTVSAVPNLKSCSTKIVNNARQMSILLNCPKRVL